ncbi:MAG: hypothetical protein KGI04_01390 [Candidatus Micrarchaeota archaeon]|nr:hypothetical protein [Candidatus Micrarchaeota archaeon]
MTYTNQEQELLERLPQGALVDHRMLADINRRLKLTTKKALNGLLSGLYQKGALVRLTRGRYLVAKNEQPDPLLIGCSLFKGYVSFDTALFFYGYRHTFSSTVYCATNRRVKARAQIRGARYVGVPLGRLAFGYVYDGGRRIATKAKLVFDIVYTRFRYIEEMQPLLDLIGDLDDASAAEFLSYTDLINETAMRERAGFLFSAARGSGRVTDYLLGKIGKKVVVKLNPGIRSLGSYSREWGVYDNAGIGGPGSRGA